MPLHACSGPLASAPKPCFHVLLSHFSTSPVCLAGHLGPGGGKAGGEWGGVLRTRSGITGKSWPGPGGSGCVPAQW